jgi:hypothetical protein
LREREGELAFFSQVEEQEGDEGNEKMRKEENEKMRKEEREKTF